jgi:5-methylcytosine-specific restriction protein A
MSNEARMRGRRLQERRKRWFALHPLCVHCAERGITTIATQLDHVTPLFRGGRDDGPVQGLCLECHQAKTAEELRGGGVL